MTPDEIDLEVRSSLAAMAAATDAVEPHFDKLYKVSQLAMPAALFEIARQLAVMNEARSGQFVAREIRKLIANYPAKNAAEQHVVLSIIEALDKAGFGGDL